MAINEQANASVHLDGQQAQQELKELKAKAAEARKELKDMKLADDPGYAKKKREVSELDAQIKKLGKSSFDLNSTIKNLSGASLKDLTRAQQVLTAQIRQTNRATQEGRQAFIQKNEQLKKVRAEISLVRGQMNGLSQSMSLSQRMANGFNRYFGMVGATVASVGGVIMGLRKTIQVFNDYEESVANLSAITGVAGDQLHWYSERAKEASVSTTEHGIRFANSAKDIVDAYTMVGSKRPELLANKEALASVTEEAMILSKAAKIQLEPAATALTTTMNQFNESADQARRIINILGAGSKVGAGNVAYLNDVIEKAGTSAKGADLSVEQLVGTIEGIAPKFSEPARAGAMLRNVFVRLQNIDDELNPTIVGWDKALENLANRQYSTAEITKLFGLESFTMVQALIDGREDIIRYTEAVTGSSIALEQAAINSDTNAARLEQARNKAQLLRIELGEKMAPALTFSTNSFSYLLKAVKEVIDNWDKYRQLLVISIALILAYNFSSVKAVASKIAYNIALKEGIGLRIKENIQLQGAIIKEAALTGWRVKGSIATKAATAAQRVFNVVVSQFPGFAIVAAIMAIVGAIKLWDTHNKAAVRQREEHNRLLDENNKLLELAKVAQYKLEPSMRNLNTLSYEHKVRLSEIVAEKIRNIEADLQQMRINQLLAKENAASVSGLQTLWSALKSVVSGKGLAAHMALQSVKNMKNAGEEFTDTISEMEAALNTLMGTGNELTKIMTAEAQANAIAGDSVAALQEKVNLYSLALQHAKIGSEDYQRIKGLLNETQIKLNSTMEQGKDTVIESVNAYQQLTRAISDANLQMQHLVAMGDYASAKATGVLIKNLEASKLLLDGIVEFGGDVIAFLDGMSNSTAAEFEEMTMFNEQFLSMWKDKANAWELSKAEQRRANLEAEMEDFKARIALAEEEVERKLQLEQNWQSARRQMVDSGLSAGFQLFSAYNYAKQERVLNDLQTQREKELENESLTEQQRLALNKRYQAEEAKIKKESFRRQQKADIIQGMINTALAVTRALPNAVAATLAGVLGGIQVAFIAAQPVPQYYSGRYPVKGATDGRTYMASIAGDPVTGIYSRPALIAERGEELIVDAPTTRNIRLNYPHLLDAIYAVRVPQYSSGRYPDSNTANQGSKKDSSQDLTSLLIDEIRLLRSTSGKLSAILEKIEQSGIHGKWVYADFKKFEQKVINIENETSI